MSVIALIPARSGSRGIPGKNFRELGGIPLWGHAAACAHRAGIDEMRIVMSTDREASYAMLWIHRPPELAQDDTPMIDVVKHAMTQIPGEPDQIWVLLQPTQPFRTPERVRDAIQLLQDTGADSVVSVVPLPLTHHAEAQFYIDRGELCPFDYTEFPPHGNRQRREQTYIRDGTCYVFWRKTVARGNIYGEDVRPLILGPSETCELDTEADWAAVEARWRAERG